MNFAVRFAPSLAVFGWIAFGGLANAMLTPSTLAHPPSWPDVRYVANGCYLSASVYLAKLREHYPAIAARPENVRLPNGRLHTVAVVHWGDRIYLRDMYMGIESVEGDVQRGFDAALARWLRGGGDHGRRERSALTSAERWSEVQAAAQWLALFQPQIIEVFSARGPIPVLWWSTADGELAFYEPTIGTAVGQTRRAPLAVATDLFGAPARLPVTD